MNEYEYINDTIARETSYNEGYEAGLACGKLCAAQQILDELEELLTTKHDEFKQARDASPDLPDPCPESTSFWEGRRVACSDILKRIAKLKNKYGVN